MNNDSIQLFLTFFSRALMLLLVMPVINCARGLAAKKMGDDTAHREGRITMNPFEHLDLLGSLMIMLIGFGWSKPMPINYAKMHNRKRGIIAVAAAGPLTHFISAILCYTIVNIMQCSPTLASTLSTGSVTWCLCIILTLLANINVCIGTINLLPLPPMDGFQILNQFTGAKFHRWYFANYANIQRVSTVILFILFFLPDPINPLRYLIGIFNYLMQLAASWVPLVFGARG